MKGQNVLSRIARNIQARFFIFTVGFAMLILGLFASPHFMHDEMESAVEWLRRILWGTSV
jgi:hypothetical protein